MRASPKDKSPEKQAALADTIKRHYDLFAAALARNGGDGWLVGDSLSWADIAFFGLVDNFARPLARETFNSHPVISAYVQRIKEHPRIAAYLASGRRPACTMVRDITHAHARSLGWLVLCLLFIRFASRTAGAPHQVLVDARGVRVSAPRPCCAGSALPLISLLLVVVVRSCINTRAEARIPYPADIKAPL